MPVTLDAPWLRSTRRRSVHQALGLAGDAHVALQEIPLREGQLLVARVGTEYREDMHRLLHHCLSPLESELGTAPYARTIKASQTAASAAMRSMFAPPQFIKMPGGYEEWGEEAKQEEEAPPRLHVQHT